MFLTRSACEPRRLLAAALVSRGALKHRFLYVLARRDQ